jgi:hypothetical protein
MLADGLFASDGSFEPFAAIDTKTLTEHFCDCVLSELTKRDLLTDDVATQLLSQEHTGFSVWAGPPFQDADSERFVARYIERGPLSLEKLSITDDIVTYTTSDGKAHEFDALELLALLSCQIPRPYESLTRYYGYYSCRARGKRKKQLLQAQQAEENSMSEAPAKPSSSWAACIKRIYEVDPLECPKCKNKMRIIAFMHDPLEINKLTESAGIENFHPPPKIPDYSSHDESLFQDYIPEYH